MSLSVDGPLDPKTPMTHVFGSSLRPSYSPPSDTAMTSSQPLTHSLTWSQPLDVGRGGGEKRESTEKRRDGSAQYSGCTSPSGAD